VLICSDFPHDLEKLLKVHMARLCELFNVYVFCNFEGDLKGATRLDAEGVENMIVSRQFSLFASITRPLGAVFVNDEYA
jgi:hypothetical protein